MSPDPLWACTETRTRTQCTHTVHTHSTHTKYTHTVHTHSALTQYIDTVRVHAHSTHTQYAHKVHTHSTHTQYTHTQELELMLKKKEKAEIQALSSFGFQYLSTDYLPRKLREGDWL